MPIYTFKCDVCSQEIEQMVKISDRNRVVLCPRCQLPARRGIDAPAMVWAPTSTGGGMKA